MWWWTLAFANAQQLIDVGAPLALGVALIVAAARGWLTPVKGAQVPVLILIAYLLLNMLLHVRGALLGPGVVRLISGDGRLIYMAVFLLIFSSIRLSNEQIDKIVRGCFFVGAGIAAFSLFSSVTGFRPIVNELQLGSMVNANGVHLSGFLGTKNPFAANLALAAIAGTYLLLRGPGMESKAAPKTLYAALLILLLVALVASRSRGYFFASLVAMLLMAIRMPIPNKKAAISGMVAVAAIAGGAFIARYAAQMLTVVEGTDANLLGREALYGRALSFIADSPLIGLGPGIMRAWEYASTPVIPHLIAVRSHALVFQNMVMQGDLLVGHHSHNFILQTVVDYGLIGLGLFIWACWRWSFFRTSQNTQSVNGRYGPLAFGLFIYCLAGGMLDSFTFASPSVSWLYYVLLGQYLAHFPMAQERRPVPAQPAAARAWT